MAILRAAEQLGPQIRDLLDGQGRTEPMRIVSVSDTPKDGKIGGECSDFGIRLYRSGTRMAPTLAHELVHAYASHTPSPWNTLPLAIEEGLAYLVQLGLQGTKEVVVKLTPPQSAIRRVATVSVEHYQGAEPGEHGVLSYLGAILVGGLGVDGLRELTARAAQEGLGTVPADWFTDAFEKAMAVRNRSSPAREEGGAWSFDPLFGRITTDRERTIIATLSFHPLEPEEPEPEEDYSEANTGN